MTAYKYLRRNLPSLLTYNNYPDLDIVNTTYALDSVFTQLKKLIKLYQEMSIFFLTFILY